MTPPPQKERGDFLAQKRGESQQENKKHAVIYGMLKFRFYESFVEYQL